jgi:hypothetical protein
MSESKEKKGCSFDIGDVLLFQLDPVECETSQTAHSYGWNPDMVRYIYEPMTIRRMYGDTLVFKECTMYSWHYKDFILADVKKQAKLAALKKKYAPPNWWRNMDIKKFGMGSYFTKAIVYNLAPHYKVGFKYNEANPWHTIMAGSACFAGLGNALRKFKKTHGCVPTHVTHKRSKLSSLRSESNCELSYRYLKLCQEWGLYPKYAVIKSMAYDHEVTIKIDNLTNEELYGYLSVGRMCSEYPKFIGATLEAVDHGVHFLIALIIAARICNVGGHSFIKTRRLISGDNLVTQNQRTVGVARALYDYFNNIPHYPENKSKQAMYHPNDNNYFTDDLIVLTDKWTPTTELTSNDLVGIDPLEGTELCK